MSSDSIISVENLSKRYIIGRQRDRRDGLRHRLEDAFRSPWRQLRQGKSNGNGKLLPPNSDLLPPASAPRSNAKEEFWALRDVSFMVKQGDAVGIVGRNGAGKSTLLKILSRITEPTEGRIRLKGRVASLLEVGTGFHLELTGRENIFLNGAILGMSRREIKRKFDEIVAFAEIEKFLDTPVKRYSSGMYVRLAFAVAAHLEPEILIVDEVLAVGDSAFQQKCMGKMKEVTRSHGRTVIFVSHNMGAIQSLCSTALLLHGGRIAVDGEVANVVQQYYQMSAPQSAIADLSKCSRTGTGEAHVTRIHLEGEDGCIQTHFRMGEPLTIVVEAEFPTRIQNPTFGVNIVMDGGMQIVADCRSSHYNLMLGLVQGRVEYRMRIPSVQLYPRIYTVEPWVADAGCMSVFDWVQGAASFEITSGPKFMSGASVTSTHGISHISTEWNARVVPTEV